MQMVNWDWIKNCPATPPTPEAAFEPGWWLNAKELLTPPLIDPTVPESKLAAWIDRNTMHVHSRLLKKLDKVRVGSKKESKKTSSSLPSSAFIVEDPYWDQLQALPREK